MRATSKNTQKHATNKLTKKRTSHSKAVRRKRRVPAQSFGERDLVGEMEHCKTTKDCIELVSTDAYGDDEMACAWEACLDSLFGSGQIVKVFGEPAILEGFDTSGLTPVAVCRKDKKPAKVAFESVELVNPTRVQLLWQKAWKEWSHA